MTRSGNKELMLPRLDWGRRTLDIDLPAGQVVTSQRAPAAAPITDLAQAMRQALEAPYRFPALRLALTPDDHVTIAVDEHLPNLVELLLPLLEHVRAAGVAPEAI